MAYDVFISYSHLDNEMAYKICDMLEASQINCWCAPRDIAPGEEWASSIVSAIKQSRIMLLIFTDNSNKSVQVMREVDNAITFGNTVIPFKLTENNPSGGMEYYLSTLHWLDGLNRPLEDSVNELKKMINSILDDDYLKEDEDGSPLKKTSGARTKKAAIQKFSRSAIRFIAGVFVAAFGAVLMWSFKLNPTIKSTTMVVILGLGIICNLTGMFMSLSTIYNFRTSIPRVIVFVLCIACAVMTINRWIKLNKLAPKSTQITDNGEQFSMNMVNSSIAVYDEESGLVYYTDVLDSIPGISVASLEDFKLGLDGRMILSGVDADSLALAGNGLLIYRNISGGKQEMCYLDINTGDTRTLKSTATCNYYTSKDFVLFNFSGHGGIALITDNGEYETSYLDEETEHLCIYRTVPYFIGPSGFLSIYKIGGTSEILSNEISGYYMLHDGYIYYNDKTGKGIYRTPLRQLHTEEKLSENYSTCMAVCGDYLYYLNECDGSALYRAALDGSSDELMIPRSFETINVIDNCIYLLAPGRRYEKLTIKQ